MPTPSPKKVRSRAERAPTADLQSSKTRGGKAYSSPEKPAPASRTHHSLGDVKESTKSDPFLSPSTTYHANIALGLEERLGELSTRNGTLTACNETLKKEKNGLRNQLKESHEKDKELERLKEQNGNLQNEVASLRNLGSEQQKVIDRLESEKIDASKQVESLQAEANSLTEMVNEQESIINQQDGIIKLQEKEDSESTKSQLQDIKAKASKIKDLEDEMKVLKQELEQQVNTNEQLVKDREAEIDRLQEEPQAKDAEIARLKKEFEAKYTQILTRFQAQIGPLREELQEKHEQIEHLQTALEEKQANAATVVTPDRLITAHPLDSALSAKRLDLGSASATPIIGGDCNGITTTELEAESTSDLTVNEVPSGPPADTDVSSASPVLSYNGNLDATMADVAGASSSHSEPNNHTAATFDSAEPPNVPIENHASTSSGEGCEGNPDVMQGLQGHPLITGDGPQYLCSSSEEAVALNDDRQTVTINSQSKVDNSDPSSVPAAEEDGLVPSSAGYVSIESPAAPLALGFGVTSMPDAGNPTVENVTSMCLAQDLDASTIKVVTSIPPVPNVDASAMENNYLAQLEAPNCEIAQHTVANFTSDISVEDTTTSPSLATGNPISDTRDTAPSLPSPMKMLCSARKDVRDLVWEPAALQHGNVSGDLSDGMKNNDGENDSIPAPGSLLSIEVSKENEPTQQQVASQSPRNHGDASLPSVPPTDIPSKSSDMSCDVSVEQATQPDKIIDDGSSMRNSPPTGDKECRKNSDIPLLSQVGSSPQRDGSRDSRPKRPESTGKPLRTNDDASGEKAPPPPKGPARANKTENPNSKASGERSDAKLTPKQIIQQSFVENSCEHVPLNFYTGRPDLSTMPYDPYAVILGDTLWEKRFVINDNDIKKLPSRLHEITKGIPEEDDIELIEYLQGNINPAEICRSGTPDEILISMALRDNDVFICSRFDSIIADIRRFSKLQVLRYIHGQNEFDKIMKNRKLKFSQFDKHTLDVLLLGHRLCSDLEFDEPWMGRRKLLFVYYWSVTMDVRKNFCMRSKLQIRYDALLRHLRDPLFLAKHHLVPSDLVTRLGRDSWADFTVVELDGVFDPWIVQCALGSSLPDPYSSRRTTAVKYLVPKSLGEQLALNESERETITAQDRMGSVAAEAAEVKEASAPIESNNRFNFDDLETSTAYRDYVWTDGSDQVMADEDPKGKKKLTINSSSTSTLLVHAAPALHKATLNAQLPSLESAKSTKIPQKEKCDALFPNTDAVVTPSRTLLPSSARTAPPNYSSPFGSLNKTAVTVARGSYGPKIHSNHQYPALDLPTVDPPRSGDNKNDHSTTASAGTPMPYNTPPRSAKSPPEDTQESREDVVPARATNNGTPVAPPSPPRSTQTSCRDTKRRKPSNSVGSPEKQQQGGKRKRNSKMIEQLNQSPSKRRRWGPFGQYLTPLSSQLDIDIKSFASDLHNNDEYILIRAHRPWTLGVECYSKSILRLQSSEWFDDELINAVSALVERPVNSRTVLLSSFLYSHLKKGQFSKVDSWIKDLSEDQTRWAFGICENNHWVVILIDFEATLILYYDPWEEEKPDHARCIRTLEDVKNWVNYLCGLDTEQNQSWQTGMLRGPKQERNDTTSCGPLAGWVLGVLRLGRDVIEGSIIYPSEVVNPLEVRTQFYHRLQAAPRTRRTAEVDGETGADSDFEEISREEASKGKGKRPSKSAKGPPVEGPSNSESKQQPPRDALETEDSSLSDDETSAAGSPWLDPNSPSFGRGDAARTSASESFTGQAFMPEARLARKGKSIPPAVRKDDWVDADVNAQTTSSSAPSGVADRETGGSAIDAFDNTPIAARVAVPTRQDIPNEALNGDPSHYLLPESPLAEQGIGPSKSRFIEMIGETTGISSNKGDIYDVPDNTVGPIQSQKRKSFYYPIYPNKRLWLEGDDDDDIAASTPRNAPNTAPSSLRSKQSGVPKYTAVSAKRSVRQVKNEATPAAIVELEQVTVEKSTSQCTTPESSGEQQAPNSGIESEVEEHPTLSHVAPPSTDMEGDSREKDIAALSCPVHSQIETPESTSNQVETEPASVIVQGDSIPPIETILEHIKSVPESDQADAVETLPSSSEAPIDATDSQITANAGEGSHGANFADALYGTEVRTGRGPVLSPDIRGYAQPSELEILDFGPFTPSGAHLSEFDLGQFFSTSSPPPCQLTDEHLEHIFGSAAQLSDPSGAQPPDLNPPEPFTPSVPELPQLPQFFNPQPVLNQPEAYVFQDNEHLWYQSPPCLGDQSPPEF